MKFLAQQLGLSVMTVSRALRNTSGISTTTRNRVMIAVRKFKYRPDPALAVLNAYRHKQRPRSTKEPIAFLTNFSTPSAWRRSVTFERYFNGTTRRAEQLGYQVEPFWMGDPDLNAQRASQILWSRGIRGLIVGPLFAGTSEIQLSWDKFSTVCLGRSLRTPKMSVISTNHFQAMQLAIAQARSFRYSRIGFAVTQHEDVRSAGALRAAYLLAQTEGDDLLPLYMPPDFSAKGVLKWAHEHSPDLLISSEQDHYDLLLQAGIKRHNIAFFHLNINPALPVAGIDQSHDLVGEKAIELLHLKLVQRESGIPSRRDMLFIDGVWKNGRGPWRLSHQPDRTLEQRGKVSPRLSSYE